MQFIRYNQSNGFVDEYYQSELCHSSLIVVPGTSLLPTALLAIVYFIFLCWLFMGIAIIADIFMEAIEVITSKTVIVEVWDLEGKNKYPIEVPVWNATLANLSLMALGSSAPEIFLSVIDTVRGLGEPAGEIGPSTIVGSAAFNLLIISALSIIAVEDVEGKKIKDLGVFAVTSIWSMIAYVWLFACLALNSPGEVDVTEAWLTFIFFIILLIMAFCVDKFSEAKAAKVEDQLNKEEAKQKEAKIQLRALSRQHGDNGNKILVQVGTNVKDKTTNQINEADKEHIKDLFCQALSKPSLDGVSANELFDVFQEQSLFERFAARKKAGLNNDQDFIEIKNQKVQLENLSSKQVRHENERVGFKCLHYAVSESSGFVNVTIAKKMMSTEEQIGVRTVEGSAKADVDFESFDEVIYLKKRD